MLSTLTADACRTHNMYSNHHSHGCTLCLQFYAMASFCNPKVFESPAHFRRYYDRPILAGREPGASDKEVQLAHERQEEMNKHCNDFILRRTNDILSDHLPPKVCVVCCAMLCSLLCFCCRLMCSVVLANHLFTAAMRLVETCLLLLLV